MGGVVKPVVPTFGGKAEHFQQFRYALTLLARRGGCNNISTESSEAPEVGVGDVQMSLVGLQEQFVMVVVNMHLGTWDILICRLASGKGRDVVLRIT